MISGVVSLSVFIIAFVGLRELAPELRDQLMVTKRERALVEARARGFDVDAATRNPLQSVLHWDLVLSSVGISVFLLIYFASVTVLTLYWVIVFNQSTANANGINQWYWGVNAVTVVVIGLLSDRLHVRKPFMLFGAVGAIVTTVFLLSRTGHPDTTYYTHVLIVCVLGFMLGVAYPAWMAGYTEAVEHRNPALTATGLAIWGWILRIVVAASFIVLPYVITTSTALVDNQQSATSLQALLAAQPYVPDASNPSPPPAPRHVVDGLLAAGPPGRALAYILEQQPTNQTLVGIVLAAPPAYVRQALGLQAFQPLSAAIRAGHADRVTAAAIAAMASNSPQLAQLLEAEKTVVPAQQAAPGEWRRWWWVCLGGQAVFLVVVFTMRGRWSPRAARRDLQAHEEAVDLELTLLANQ
jgi:hypothetical protein